MYRYHWQCDLGFSSCIRAKLCTALPSITWTPLSWDTTSSSLTSPNPPQSLSLAVPLPDMLFPQVLTWSSLTSQFNATSSQRPSLGTLRFPSFSTYHSLKSPCFSNLFTCFYFSLSPPTKSRHHLEQGPCLITSGAQWPWKFCIKLPGSLNHCWEESCQIVMNNHVGFHMGFGDFPIRSASTSLTNPIQGGHFLSGC